MLRKPWNSCLWFLASRGFFSSPVYPVEQGISMVWIFIFICFLCETTLYMMKLSMRNYLPRYDGFHSQHFTASGLMEVDRNNSSSLGLSDYLCDMSHPRSHDWRKYTNQHHHHMRSLSLCLWSSLWRPKDFPPLCNLPAVSLQSGGLWQGASIIQSQRSIFAKMFHQCYVSATVTTKLTVTADASVKRRQWVRCSLKISDSHSSFTEQQTQSFGSVGCCAVCGVMQQNTNPKQEQGCRI